MNLIEVRTMDEMKMLSDSNALTVIGITEESFQAFYNLVSKFAKFMKEDVYLVKGKTVNELCGFSPQYCYRDDLNILAIPLWNLDVHDIYGLRIAVSQKNLCKFSLVMKEK